MEMKKNVFVRSRIAIVSVSIVCCILYTGIALASSVLQPNSALVNAQRSGLLSTQDWREYDSTSYNLSIRYPENLTVSTGAAFTNMISGEVVAFVPVSLSDYSYTNLVNYAVLIGVTTTISPSAAAIERKNNPLYACEILTNQGNKINELYFSRYYSAEGTAGHLYEKISCRVLVNGTRYEIAMVICSANLGAMPTGVMPFDAARLGRLFETMLHTFEVAP